MAPRIDRLFDHTVRVWRPVRVKDNLGAQQTTYQNVATIGVAVNRSAAPMGGTSGGGLAPVGRIRMYARPDADVQPRDILEFLTGGSSVGTWEIDEPPSRPKNHHTQLDCAKWNGILIPAGES